MIQRRFDTFNSPTKDFADAGEIQSALNRQPTAREPTRVRWIGLGGVAEHPVSLIDIYPTLVDLCGLEAETQKNSKGAPLDGHSVRPFLENPQSGKWDGPEAALSIIYAGAETKMDPGRQHWTVRTRRWRYIRYNTGAEELYDHDTDPHEWTNLAVSPEHKAIKTSLYEMMLEMRRGRPAKQ